MYGAGCLWCIPNITITVFSTGKRTSSSLMTSVLTLFCNIPGARDKIITQNAEKIVIDMGRGDIRTITCQPGSVRNGPSSALYKSIMQSFDMQNEKVTP